MTQVASSQSPTQPLSDLNPEEMATAVGLKPYQGRQLFRWIHQKRVFDFSLMSDLAKPLRKNLERDFTANRLTLQKVSESPESQTKKILLALEDGELVESVSIPDRARTTYCLSTHVGCAVKCSFCATGLSGFARNLSPGEIVEQALYLMREHDLGELTPNIVFMGMGEPFRNYEATIKSIRLLMHKDGLGIGARRITVSTAGQVDGIERFAEEEWQVRLSISLHAANDTLRDELVPLNRRFNIERLLNAVQTYIATTGRQVTFEWTLLEGVNDSERDAAELVERIKGMKASVNLIPYNPVMGADYHAPSIRTCEKFRKHLTNNGIKATLRAERGQDIDAACGQLRRTHIAAERIT
jgi:23S rRNA (adenine2503-C2)-methyltransferase